MIGEYRGVIRSELPSEGPHVLVARYVTSICCFVDHCLSFCPFYFWSVLFRIEASYYPFAIFNNFLPKMAMMGCWINLQKNQIELVSYNTYKLLTKNPQWAAGKIVETACNHFISCVMAALHYTSTFSWMSDTTLHR